MFFPENIEYSKNHLWVSRKGCTIFIGVTDYAQMKMGHIIYVDVNSIGDNLEKYRIFGSIESANGVNNLIMPVNGTVIEFNGDLDKYPTLINDDPYGAGWIIQAELDDLAGTEKLMNSKEYIEYIAELEKKTQ